MQIGQQIRCKKEGKIIICYVVEMFENDILLEHNKEQFTRKYWEIRPIEK